LDLVSFFFFSSRRRHTRFSRDWSSDVCSSDLYYPPNGVFSHQDSGKKNTPANNLSPGVPFYGDIIASISNCHFVDQVAGIGEFVDNKQYVADIDGDGTLQFVVEDNVAGHGLDVAVEGNSNQFAVTVQHRGTGVTTGDIIIRQEIDGQVTLLIGIAAIVARLIQFPQPLGEIKLLIARLVLGNG